MNIEIVEFYYPQREGGKVLGTLHVYLIDQNIDLRFIKVVCSKKGGFAIEMPFVTLSDVVNKKKHFIRAPFFQFVKKSDWEDFYTTLCDMLPKYLEEEYPEALEKFERLKLLMKDKPKPVKKSGNNNQIKRNLWKEKKKTLKK